MQLHLIIAYNHTCRFSKTHLTVQLQVFAAMTYSQSLKSTISKGIVTSKMDVHFHGIHSNIILHSEGV